MLCYVSNIPVNMGIFLLEKISKLKKFVCSDEPLHYLRYVFR